MRNSIVSLERRLRQGKRKIAESRDPEGYWKDILSPSSVPALISALCLRLNWISLAYSICSMFVKMPETMDMTNLDSRISYELVDIACPDVCF